MEKHVYEGVLVEVTVDDKLHEGCGVYEDGNFVGFLLDGDDARRFMIWRTHARATEENKVIYSTTSIAFAKGVVVGLTIAIAVAFIFFVTHL